MCCVQLEGVVVSSEALTGECPDLIVKLFLLSGCEHEGPLALYRDTSLPKMSLFDPVLSVSLKC